MRLYSLLAFLLALLASVSAQGSDLTAVLTQIEGTVTVAERFSPERSRSPSRPLIRRARILQILRSGDALHIPRGARVGFVCSTERWVLLFGKAERRLDANVCSDGEPLTPGTYRSLVPEAGRLRSVRGAIVLEREIRGQEEDPAIPVLLEPRNTAVLAGRPDFQWTRVKGATEYLIEMVGDVSFQARFDAGDVSCPRAPGWGNREVCSIPYPQSAPELPPGALMYLDVGARRGIASPWLRELVPRRVQRLTAAHAAEVRARIDVLATTAPGEMARRLLEADLYANEGLFKDALAGYHDLLALQNIPEVLVTRGDIYLETGLLEPAAWSYQAARRIAGRPLVIDAAAELGLGRVEYVRRNFSQAREHFRRSRDLYAGRGLIREAAAAERAAEEARLRIQ